MSKVARKPVHIPENTKVSINNNEISVEGPLGKMSFTKENGISVSEIDGKLNIKTEDNNLIAFFQNSQYKYIRLHKHIF